MLLQDEGSVWRGKRERYWKSFRHISPPILFFHFRSRHRMTWAFLSNFPHFCLSRKKRSIYHTYWKQFFINILLAFSCATGNENSIMIISVELENDKKSLLPAIMNLTTHYIMWSWFQGWFLAWNYKKGQIHYQYSLFSMNEKVNIDCLEFHCFFFFFSRPISSKWFLSSCYDGKLYDLWFTRCLFVIV